MPMVYGRKHGNGYHGNVTQKVTFVSLVKGTECTSPKVMQFRLREKLIIKKCPATCEFFEQCVAKSGEVRE